MTARPTKKELEQKVHLLEESALFLEEALKQSQAEVARWKEISAAWEKLAKTPAPETETERLSRYLTPELRNKARIVTEQIAAAYGVTPEEIKSLTKRQPVAEARAVVMYLLREAAGFSTTQTAEIVGRTHSNVSKMTDRVRNFIQTDTRTATWIAKVRKEVQNSLARSERSRKHHNQKGQRTDEAV